MFRVIAGRFSRFILLSLIGCFSAADASLAGVFSYAEGEIEVSAAFGPLQAAGRSDWLEEHAAIPPIAYREKTADSMIVSSDFLILYAADSEQVPLLEWRHGRSFVSILSDGRVRFSVSYTDPYGNAPSAGYPKVIVWPISGTSSSTVTLSGDGTVYEADVDLPHGMYGYRYVVKNDITSGEYVLESGTVSVTDHPAQPEALGISDEARVTNARVSLAWSPLEGLDPPGTYRLYVGKASAARVLVYEGTEPRFELCMLDPNQEYCWQVETINAAGASSLSPVYRFATIALVRSAYNYPNPFNPSINEVTHFVFYMSEAGTAELRLYSEYGDLCWQTEAGGLYPGVNQVVYSGNDDNGEHLHNGTYLCVITKKYSGREERERCRILVIH